MPSAYDKQRICNYCHKAFTGARCTARYCSVRCRVAAQRRRKGHVRPSGPVGLQEYGDAMMDNLYILESSIGGAQDRAARGYLKNALIQICSTLMVTDGEFTVAALQDAHLDNELLGHSVTGAPVTLSGGTR